MTQSRSRLSKDTGSQSNVIPELANFNFVFLIGYWQISPDLNGLAAAFAPTGLWNQECY